MYKQLRPIKIPLKKIGRLRCYRMSRIQIVSDVHLEFHSKKSIPTITPCAPFLALLGDIGKPFTEQYRQFIQTQSKQFEKVFVVMGNHEYYNSNFTAEVTLERTREILSAFDNVFLLERDAHELDDCVLLGCTLWSSITPYAAYALNDFNKIYIYDSNKIKRQLTREIYLKWHHRDVTWLEKEIYKWKTMEEEDRKRVVVLTHHAPLEVMSGEYQGSPVSSGFTSSLDHMFEPPVVAFANGHVHSNCDVELNGIRCVSNAMGYPGEKTGYKEDVVVDI